MNASAVAERKPTREESAKLALRMVCAGKSLPAAARAVGVSAQTLRLWLAGNPEAQAALERQRAEAKAATAALVRKLAVLKKSPEASKHCGVTGKPCPKAYRCNYGAAGSLANGSEDTRIEMCAHAIGSSVGDCRTCPHYGPECLAAWRCWKMELGELDLDMCADIRAPRRASVFEVAHGTPSMVRARKGMA